MKSHTIFYEINNNLLVKIDLKFGACNASNNSFDLHFLKIIL